MTRETFDKRIPIAEIKNGREVNNPPDAPHATVEPLNKLRMVVTTNTNILLSNGHVISEATVTDKHRGTLKALAAIPQTKRPIQEFKVASTRGGEPIGGGTSKEALRRAKRKTRKPNNNHSGNNSSRKSPRF